MDYFHYNKHFGIHYYLYHYTLIKEIGEITHACGYEHPCQVQMKDIDISCGDNNKTITLEQAFRYEKDVVPFTAMSDLFDCQYLAGLGKLPNALNKH